MVAKGKGFEGGVEWEAGVSRGNLQFIEGINNKVYSYLMTKHNEKEYKKCIYIYIYI